MIALMRKYGWYDIGEGTISPMILLNVQHLAFDIWFTVTEFGNPGIQNRRTDGWMDGWQVHSEALGIQLNEKIEQIISTEIMNTANE